MEVGIEDCLHIEFEYDRGAYHMGDTVLGRIHFLLVGGQGRVEPGERGAAQLLTAKLTIVCFLLVGWLGQC